MDQNQQQHGDDREQQQQPRSPARDQPEVWADDGLSSGFEQLQLHHSGSTFDDLDDHGSRSVQNTLADDLLALNNEVFRALQVGGSDVAYGQAGPLASMAAPDDALAMPFASLYGDGGAESALGMKHSQLPAGGLADAAAAFGAADGAEPPRAEPQLPLGSYLEPNAHAFSNARPDELLQAAADAAAAEGADVDVVYHRYQVSALAYSGGHEVSFKVRVFLSPLAERGRYAVEVQRRQGDAWTFWRVCRSVMDRLASAGLLAGSQAGGLAAAAAGGETSLQVAPALELGDACFDDVEVTAEQWQAGVRPLLHMAQSTSPKTQFEGLRHLSQDAAAEAGARDALLANDEAFRTLVDAAGSEHRNVHRCALLTLAALAAAAGSTYPDTLASDEAAMRAVMRHLESTVREVVRVAMRLLVAISDASPANLAAASELGLAAHVRRLTSSPDATVRQQAETLRTRFML